MYLLIYKLNLRRS